MTIDPITLAVIRGSLEQIADEMDATLERMAFSPVISDGFDRAIGIYDKTNGEVIMQGPRGLPSFLSKGLIDEFILSIHPILIGTGIPLFLSNEWETRLRLRNSTRFDSGLVQLHYGRE